MHGGTQCSEMSKYDQILKIYHGNVLIAVTYPLNGMFVCLGDGCQSISATFKAISAHNNSNLL